jgi:acetyl esterase/lipase
VAFSATGAEPVAYVVRVLTNVPYKEGVVLSAYEQQRCKLDLYLPEGLKAFPTLVWFHGGGLKEGAKNDVSGLARSLAREGIAVVCPNYRLSPKATYPAYVKDAAAASAWTCKRIADYEGNPGRVYVGGHSAGGYLAFMLGVDDRWLRECGLERTNIAGLIPVSGQTMTHYTIREERGLGKFNFVADDAAPVYYGRKDTPPMLVLYADHDMLARQEENELLVAIMKGAGNSNVIGRLLRDRDHGSIAQRLEREQDPGRQALIEFIRNGPGISR